MRLRTAARPAPVPSTRTQGRAGRDPDGALASVLAPLVRDQVKAAGPTQLSQGVDVQLVPVVERLIPDEIVQVEGLCAGEGCGQRRSERSLARSTSPVDSDDRRPPWGVPTRLSKCATSSSVALTRHRVTAGSSDWSWMESVSLT